MSDSTAKTVPRRSLRGWERVGIVCAAGLCVLGIADNLWSVASGVRLRGAEYGFLSLLVAWLAAVTLHRRYAARWALVGLSALATLFVVELLLGVGQRSSRAFDWYVWPPNYQCRTATRGLAGVAPRGRFTINSLGLRGAEPREDAYRILCIGGSTTECFYLDDAKSWPALLERGLGELGNPVWVGNAGRSGLMAADHALLLETLPEAAAADCWIVLCGVNDMGQQLRGVYAESVADSFQRTFVYRRPGLTHSWRRPWQRNLQLVEQLEAVRHRIKASFRDADYEVVQDTAAAWIDSERQRRAAGAKTADLPDLAPLLDEYERQLTRIIARARASEKRLILLTQPVLWQTPMPPELDALCLGGEVTSRGFLTTEQRATAMQAYNARLLAVAAREGVEYVDLAGTLPRTLETFYDDCHFNEQGARSVAAAIVEQFLTSHTRAAGESVPVAASRDHR